MYSKKKKKKKKKILALFMPLMYTMPNLEALIALYENIETGLKPYRQFYKEHKQAINDMGYTSLKSVTDTLKKETISGQLNKTSRKVIRSKIKAATPWQTLHLDFMTIKATSSNLQDANILVMVDVYSRYIWARRYPTKSAKNVIKFFEDIIPSFPGVVDIVSDGAPEFTNAIEHFDNLQQTVSTSLFGAAIAERAIRKLRMLWRDVKAANPQERLSASMLEKMVDNLNKRKVFNGGRTSPDDIMHHGHYIVDDTLLLTTKDLSKESEIPTLTIGDFVRIKNDVYKSGVFVKKSETSNYRREPYRVFRKTFNIDQQLFQYHVQSISGDFLLQRPFYIEELIPMTKRELTRINPQTYTYKKLTANEKNMLGYLEVK